MSVKKIKEYVKNNRFIFCVIILIMELPGFFKKWVSFPRLDLDDKKLVKKIREDGFVIIPNFFSKDEVNSILETMCKHESKCGLMFDNDCRIFGFQHISDLVMRKFYSSPYLKKIAENYLSENVINQTTMIGHIRYNANFKEGSGGGFHRDSFSRQFKSVIYLTDVAPESGPFTYYKSSHKLKYILMEFILKFRDFNFSSPRYSNKEIDAIAKRFRFERCMITGSAGDLLLADVRGLHTGSPIMNGERVALFNYYIGEKWHVPGSEIDQLDLITKNKFYEER